MDTSFEQVVRKADYSADYIRFKVYTVLLAISLVAALAGIILVVNQAYLLGIAEAVIGLALTILFFRLRDGAVIEYDYEYSDGDINIARISHDAKRKELYSINVADIDIIAPFDSIDDHVPSLTRRIDISLNDERKYFIYCTVKGEKVAIIWQPKEDMVKLIKSERPMLVKL